MHIIDWHCDTILKLWRSEGKEALAENHLSIDLEKLRAGHSLAQFFAVFIDLKEHPQPFAAFHAMTDLFQQELTKNSGQISLARSMAELQAYAKRKGFKPGWAYYQGKLRGWVK